MWYMITHHWLLLFFALVVGTGIGWWLCRPQSDS
ncbi:hypothetical protein GGD81_004214 [Rhodobium orientis]|uniref:Uncharacterized protein n=1 Tax=Rhodobium gokarnense TaxID=364296 RepID=A0ABT3HG39_9HYPH|nr:hypothetical protein [Rhodobium orientis]MCW2309354.1 hypothetical protein [Rhodobium gokarnense]